MEFRLQAAERGRDQRIRHFFMASGVAHARPAKAGTPYVWSSAFRRPSVAATREFGIFSWRLELLAPHRLKPGLRTYGVPPSGGRAWPRPENSAFFHGVWSCSRPPG